MVTTLRPNQMLQVESFWNLLQASGESVQRELYILLQRKYGDNDQTAQSEQPSFLLMKGILSGKGNVDTDRQMIDEYLQAKYGV